MKRTLQIILGVFFILLGIAGLFLPFLQGILLIILGINVLSPEHGKKFIAYCKEIWQKFKHWWKTGCTKR